jgi:hypothetical protein
MIALASQQSLPSQPARKEVFVAFLISKRALVCSLVHPALTQAKGDKAMIAKTQTKMTFLAKQQVSISQQIFLVDATTETAYIYIYIYIYNAILLTSLKILIHVRIILRAVMFIGNCLEITTCMTEIAAAFWT